MKLLNYFPLLFLSVLLLSSAPANKKILIVAEYDDNAAKNHIQYLVSYTFINGAMTQKETLMVVPLQKQGVQGDYVRFDIGKNKLYRNRYIVSGIGNVIDLKLKKIVLTEKDNFVAFSGDSIVFHTDDIFKGEYYSVFDLKTEQYKKVENANYNPLAKPDVELDETAKPFKIVGYFANGKKDVLLADAGYGELKASNVTEQIKSALFWLDKKFFLYASYSQKQDAVIIYKIGIDKSVEKLGEIQAIPNVATISFFEFGLDGSVVYSCDKGRFAIDAVNKTVEKKQEEFIGNKFSIESHEEAAYGRKIKYNGEEVGKKWCRFDNAQSISEYLAVQNDMQMNGERYPLGVAVWHVATKKWTQIEASNVSNIIGWIEE